MTTTRDAIWAGRLSGEVHELFKRFNDSLPFDRRLFEEDLDGSAAWARAIEKAGVLTKPERQRIESAIEAIRGEVRADPSRLTDADDEDIHSFVERELVAQVGDAFYFFIVDQVGDLFDHFGFVDLVWNFGNNNLLPTVFFFNFCFSANDNTASAR